LKEKSNFISFLSDFYKGAICYTMGLENDIFVVKKYIKGI